MPPEAAVQALRDVQREFTRSLRGEAASTPGPTIFVDAPPLAATDRVAVYRNNTRQFFRTALALTYPVLLRRVGEQYFRQLAHEYREAHPSRSGDLHWVGATFPDWLAARLQQGDYAWLADLARLEWACEEAAAAAVEPAVSVGALGAVPPEALDGARLRFQPSLRLVASAWPVWSVWQANQGEDAGAPVDSGIGPQHCACACLDDRVVVYRLEAEDHAVLAALRAGATLAEAITQSRASPDVLARVLGWAFEVGLVVEVRAC
ncbi:MAG TPA: DNA-binding domain-containing protein [Steroidobacteraceae bacterium]|nr:DNA-binding domain-containing protein [Steroidobacteraceae bacterium]